LSNAVKYTDQGFISLSVKGETADEDGLILNIEVADSGRGIDDEDVEKLFDKFTRFDMARNKNVEGSGLGLAITKTLVETMGGEIDLQSARGEGSVFTVRLPQKISNRKKLANVEDIGKMNVLIYERREICKNSIIRTMDELGVSYKFVPETHEFYEELISNAYSHVFIAAVLYEHAKSEYGDLKTDAKILLVAEFGEIVKERNISVLTTPIYSIPVANFLNDVSGVASDSIALGKSYKYIAPGVKVLSVDDVSTNLSVLEGLLKMYEVKVTSCKSGMEAITALENMRYDLVFMDHMMPGMDGIETTEQIRTVTGDDPDKARLPVIALSANAVLGAREMFLQNGFDDFLSKPIDMTKLHEILVKWIPEHKWELTEERNSRKENDSGFNMEIKGVNVKKGVALTGGTIDNYTKTLATFHKDGLEKNRQLRSCLVTADLPLFTIYIHALKSAAANIGADNLSEAASALEEAGKEGDISYVTSNSVQFLTDLEALLDNINTALL